MTFTKHTQVCKAKESKIDDLYLLFAIFSVSLQEKVYMEAHLQIGDVHEYYGSIANIYEFHSSEELGITYGSLRNYGLSANKPYGNNKCIIRKGVLHQKTGGRGRKS